MPTRVRLLGRPFVEHDGLVVDLPPGKKSALLYYLAYRQEWVPRGDLLVLLWPDSAEERARANLRQLLVAARRLPYAERLEVRHHAVRWAVESDLARVAVDDAVLLAPVAPLLEGFRLDRAPEFESWLQLERDGLKSRLRDARLRAAEDRDGPHALRLLGAILRDDPLDEEVVRRAMVLEVGLRRRREALGRYGAFRDRLMRELGVKPSPETERLAGVARSIAGAVDPDPRPPDASPGTPVDGGSVAVRPRASAGFVGREHELHVLAGWIEDPRVGIVTVLGPGGVGKSRLAAELLARDAGAPPDGTYFVPLTTTEDATGVAPAVAAVLGIPLHGDPATALLAAMRDRRMVIVIDNVEQVRGLVPWLRRMRSGAPGVRWVATSRVRLDLQDEHVLELAGLDVPGATRDPLRTSTSVRLLLERARASGVVLDGVRDEESIRRIARATGGLPLALELAAGALRVLAPEAVATELETGAYPLHATAIDVEPRHASLRAVYESSWSLLTDRERRAAARLSVFHGGFTAEAAARVAEVGVPLLLALRNKSFLAAASDGRFGFHPVIETLTRERATQSVAALEELRARHAAVTLSHFASYERVAQRDRDPAALERLSAERANLAVAWRWAVGAQRWDLLELCGPMGMIAYLVTGRAQEIVALFDLSIGAVPRSHRAWAHLTLLRAALRAMMDHPDEAAAPALRAKHAFAALNDARGVGWSAYFLGLIASLEVRFDDARAWYREAIHRLREVDEVRPLQAALLNLGDLSIDHDEKLALVREAESLNGRARSREAIIYQHGVTARGAHAHARSVRRGASPAAQGDRARARREPLLGPSGDGWGMRRWRIYTWASWSGPASWRARRSRSPRLSRWVTCGRCARAPGSFSRWWPSRAETAPRRAAWRAGRPTTPRLRPSWSFALRWLSTRGMAGRRSACSRSACPARAS